MDTQQKAAAYFSGIKKLLKTAEDVDESARMSRYLRDQFKFLGIKTPQRRALQKRYRDEHGELPLEEMKSFVTRCFKEPYRELQYTGIDLAIRASKRAPDDQWKLYEQMITTKSWWDSVDPVATTLVTTHLQRFEHLNPELPDRWIRSSNIWLQRTAMLFQLKYRTQTNAAQLFGYIDAIRDSEEFFLQKAAGWALREYSRHEPEAVQHYIANNELPALTVREGLKLLNRRQS